MVRSQQKMAIAYLTPMSSTPWTSWASCC